MVEYTGAYRPVMDLDRGYSKQVLPEYDCFLATSGASGDYTHSEDKSANRAPIDTMTFDKATTFD